MRSQAKNSKPRTPFIPAWWRENLLADLSGTELKVYLAYLSHKNAHGLAWPSRESLEKSTGLCIDAVKNARSGLVGKGLLLPMKQGRTAGQFGEKAFQVCTVVDKTAHGTVDGSTAHGSTDHGPTAGGETTHKGSPCFKVPQSFELTQKEGAQVDAVRRPNDAELRSAHPEIIGGFRPSTPEEKPSGRKRFTSSDRKAKLTACLSAKARSGGNMFDGTLNDDQQMAFSYIRWDDFSNLTDGFVWAVEDLYLDHKDQLPPPGILCCKIIDKLKSEIESLKKLGGDPSEYYWPTNFQAHRNRLRAEERERQ